MTIVDGSKSYIDAVMKGFPPNHLFLNAPVVKVTSTSENRVNIRLSNGRQDIYDHVILATHGDQAYELIKEGASEEELAILSDFTTSESIAILHSDLSLMPKSEEAWSSWNYLTKSCPKHGRPVDEVSLTYNMNILQHIPRDIFGDVLVTLNPLHEPDENTVQGRFGYRHPLYTSSAVRAQKLLPNIQNRRGISYCGAWTKYGFHEDGFSSGLLVAQDHLGAKLPFAFRDSTFSRGTAPTLTLLDHVLRLIIQLIQTLVIIPMEVVMGVKRRKPKLTNGVKHKSRDRNNSR